MRAMVIDSAFRCIFLSEVDPTYKLRGRTPQNVTGTCATNWISENVDSWKKAANSCFTIPKATALRNFLRNRRKSFPLACSISVHQTRPRTRLGDKNPAAYSFAFNTEKRSYWAVRLQPIQCPDSQTTGNHRLDGGEAPQ